MNNIINLLATIHSNANEATKVAKRLNSIPCAEELNVWHDKKNKLNISFEWHGHKIEVFETDDDRIQTRYDEEKISEHYWSAETGRIKEILLGDLDKRTKAKSYIIDQVYNMIYDLSTDNRKIALPKQVQYGDYTIWAEGPAIFAEKNGNKIYVMGHGIFGQLWVTHDIRVANIQAVIKKAFRK